jgi:hypothetical protein
MSDQDLHHETGLHHPTHREEDGGENNNHGVAKHETTHDQLHSHPNLLETSSSLEDVHVGTKRAFASDE